MRTRVVALAGLGLILMLGAGYTVKNLCTTHDWNGFQYRSSCYNDIFSLHSFRGLDQEPIPYIHGSGELDDEIDEQGNQVERGDLEYPVGTGLVIAAVALATPNGVAFFKVTALVLALFGAISFGLLTGLADDPRRLFLFALAPTLGLYAFHNWDLLAVAAMCGALVLFSAGRDGAAGAVLGLGAAAKVFPGVLLPVMVFARYRSSRRISWPMIAWSAGAFAAVNLPFLLINAKGWFLPWDFQSTRFPNYETHWYMIYRHLGDGAGTGFWWDLYPRLTSLISLALFAAGVVWLIRSEMRREVFRPYVTAFGVMLLFLLTGKIYSPQFALWLLPFFVLVKVPLRAFVAFIITDAAAWAGVSYFFLAPEDSSRMDLLEIAVWVRYAVLAWILWMSRRADENVVPRLHRPAEMSGASSS